MSENQHEQPPAAEPKQHTVMEQLADIRRESLALNAATSTERDSVLEHFSELLRADSDRIIAINKEEVEHAKAGGLSEALIDRLTLTAERVEGIASAVDEVRKQNDPLDEPAKTRVLDNGLRLEQRRVPFGVICVVYEARPNVTADAAALAIKSGNAIVLRGSSQSIKTNEAIASNLYKALAASSIPPGVVYNFPADNRAAFKEMIGIEGGLDLIIPRGGEALKRFLLENARVPVLAAAGGNCHIFVDESADEKLAKTILLNAKTQRPGVCNAAETVLVHAAHKDKLLPKLLSALSEAGVRTHYGDHAFETEYLDLDIAVGIVEDMNAAILHINEYGTGHSEAIITQSEENAERFVRSVDAAAVYVNASTRFTDGGVFGLGAEVGISTSKLHARGPIGARELTTTKYALFGTGQIR